MGTELDFFPPRSQGRSPHSWKSSLTRPCARNWGSRRREPFYHTRRLLRERWHPLWSYGPPPPQPSILTYDGSGSRRPWEPFQCQRLLGPLYLWDFRPDQIGPAPVRVPTIHPGRAVAGHLPVGPPPPSQQAVELLEGATVGSARGPDRRRPVEGRAVATSRRANDRGGPLPPQPEGRRGVAALDPRWCPSPMLPHRCRGSALPKTRKTPSRWSLQ